MAKITIGGVDHTIQEMNFVAVEMAWPFMEQAMATVHPIAGTNAALAVIAAGMMESEGFDASMWKIETTVKDDEDREFPRAVELIHIDLVNVLRRSLRSSEMGAVKLCLFDIIAEAGFDMQDALPGGAMPVGEAASPSPETVTNTLPSSLPQESKEEAGTA